MNLFILFPHVSQSHRPVVSMAMADVVVGTCSVSN